MAENAGPTRRTVLGSALAMTGLATTGVLTGGAEAAAAGPVPRQSVPFGGGTILVRVGNIKVEPLPLFEYDDGTWFRADDFTFGVERELKDKSEKGGTQDINIGVGELQECTISKSMDWASAELAQLAINGNTAGQADIHFVGIPSDDGRPVAYLKYKLDRCFVKSWSTSSSGDDRPTEEVAFYYNKIAFGVFGDTGGMSWDNVKNVRWADPGIEF